MKKIFLLFLLLVCVNVNGASCNYVVRGTPYTIEFELHDAWYDSSDWRHAYSVNGKPLDEQSFSTGGITVIGGNNSLFASFQAFGTRADDSACPVLVSVGGNNYTFMPYDNYIYLFFS